MIGSFLMDSRFMVAKGEGRREVGWTRVNRCKLLDSEWIDNEVLLYSIRNDVQSFVMENDER